MLGKFLRSKKKNKEWRGGNSNGRPKVAINELELLQLKDAGKSNREIAQIFRVSEATIRRRLKDLGG
ncbi:helix-turn-helix domain-containing protein [Lysinibacillus sp. CNPSo 3705]|uniref:helix-turn-helix domain-containing protein n=1 Tax=Lysinibacillus sp. CNPSo 3705 TaxID=3028148 RepID=UPI00104CF0FE|nr:helix-turn-helix domain-containing protein [Lysinibacillus sp. CNPSo 3705]MDD1501504.1 helix-turn-helix domain-containing protein [Lysinibacillus sp. CNPSo 3705]